jgi:hypothetical protein
MATLETKPMPRTRITSALMRAVALASIPLALTVAGCGVELNAEQETTEIFKDVVVTNDQRGEPRAGEQLLVRVEYTQPYPRDLDVECELLNAAGTTKVSELSVAIIPANPSENIPTAIVKNYKDEVTPVAGSVEMIAFAPAEPGTYMVNCFTQEDDNNEIERTITIGAAAAPPP